MARNFTIPRTSHVRSTSLPSTSHPLDSYIEVLLHKLNNEVKPSNTSTSSICKTLYNMHDLYNNVNCSIQCPGNQQLLSLEQHRNGVENVLEGSLGLIDSFASTKDVLSLMKESILELQSCFRRKNGGEEKGIYAYMMSRKNTRKMANKCLKNLHNKQNWKNNEGGIEILPILAMLGEVETISLSTMKCILNYMSKSKRNGKVWCLVDKLMNSKRVLCNGVEDDNEIQKIDQAIFGLELKNSSVNVKMVQELVKELEIVESFIQEIEGCLESITRCLLKTRVSLLNVVSSC